MQLSRFSVRAQGSANIIRPQTAFHIVASFNPRILHVGRYTARAVFEFEDIETQEQFSIARSLSAAFGDQTDHELLKPTAPYTKPKLQGQRTKIGRIIWGNRPSHFARHIYKVKLPVYNIPPALEAAISIENQNVGAIIDRLPAQHVPQMLSRDSYVSSMSTQLWIEEYQAKSVFSPSFISFLDFCFHLRLDIQHYNLESVYLRKIGANGYL